MDPLSIGLGLGVSALVSGIAAAFGAGDEAKARQLREQIAAEYGAAALPSLDRKVAELMPPDAAARYTRATEATAGQSLAMRKLSDLVREGGETAQERAGYLRSQMETGRAAAGAQSAALRGMDARGLAGSPAAGAVALQGSQSALDRNALANTQEAADAANRRTGAIGALGSLSGQARGQDLQALGAQDAISRFNALQRQAAQDYNLGLNQQQFDNRMALLAGKSNAAAGVANSYERSAQGTREMGAGLGNAALTAGIGFDEYFRKKNQGG